MNTNQVLLLFVVIRFFEGFGSTLHWLASLNAEDDRLTAEDC